jgi:branched-chain amino acid transport system ATP-binding protein
MNVLQLQNVHTHILGFHILEGVDLAVRPGRLCVLLGRNGAGKTTAMRTIIGLTPPSSGQILFEGRPIEHLRDYQIPRLGIALVPENRDVFSDLTVEENLRLALRGGKKVKGARLDYIIEVFPLMKDLMKKKGGNLSGGEKQVVAVARALINDNRLLLIDEPTKGLAPIVIEALGRALAEIKKQTTILLVEQNFEFSAAIGDDYFIMESGRIVNGGEMADIAGDKELQIKYLGV